MSQITFTIVPITILGDSLNTVIVNPNFNVSVGTDGTVTAKINLVVTTAANVNNPALQSGYRKTVAITNPTLTEAGIKASVISALGFTLPA